MSSFLNAESIDADAFFGLDMPLQDGLELWVMPNGTTVADLLKNYAPEKADLVGLTGAAPVLDGESATISYSTRVNTGVVVGLNWCMAALVMVDPGHSSPISSLGVPDATGGDGLVSFAAGSPQKWQAFAAQSGGAAIAEITRASAALTSGKYAFIAGVGTPSGVHLYIGKDGALQHSYTAATSSRSANTKPIYLGGYLSDYPEAAQSALFAVWSKQRTEAELLSLYQYLRDLCSGLDGGDGVQ